ncbi:hypothetical protein KQX54_020626 [Cotesia glomerata]|uniref:Uncharacterized protein n=1 Tax=Cotesia glomerata TaxID=32391 RepID=A0AAV7HM29_COTGL|nr:hypothetical protein KQX54_020626 [Cotesia glomerata]
MHKFLLIGIIAVVGLLASVNFVDGCYELGQWCHESAGYPCCNSDLYCTSTWISAGTCIPSHRYAEMVDGL